MTGVEEVMDHTAGIVDASTSAALVLAAEIGRLQETISRLRVDPSASARGKRLRAAE